MDFINGYQQAHPFATTDEAQEQYTQTEKQRLDAMYDAQRLRVIDGAAKGYISPLAAHIGGLSNAMANTNLPSLYEALNRAQGQAGQCSYQPSPLVWIDEIEPTACWRWLWE